MLDNVLEKIRANSANTVQKGLGFEKLIKNYLQTEPQYDFSQVWLWREWEQRPQAVDTGIDIVAKTLAGEYVAVQCKCYAQEHTLVKENIDSFFTASGQRFQTEDGDWHLNYETVQAYALEEITSRPLNAADYRVQKMQYAKTGKTPDKSSLIYNASLTLTGIPPETYEYIVNGKSALDWIIERYQITTDKDSGIRNDPNHWSDDPRYSKSTLKID